MGVSATSSGCNVEPSYSLLLCLSFRICKLRPTRAGWCTVIMKMGGLVPCGATQDGRVMVESSDKKWSTGEGNGKPLQYSCLENPMNSMKRERDRTLKDELPRLVGAQYAPGEQWRTNSRKNEEMEPKQK